eukprot:4020175-Pleurochrysis_carterae.AAC.2
MLRNFSPCLIQSVAPHRPVDDGSGWTRCNPLPPTRGPCWSRPSALPVSPLSSIRKEKVSAKVVKRVENGAPSPAVVAIVRCWQLRRVGAQMSSA